MKPFRLVCLFCFTAFLLNVGDLAAQQPGEQKKQVDAKKVESQKEATKEEPVEEKPAEEKTVALLNIEMQDIDGKTVNLKKYEGKVVLIVNVASKCGFTGQYKPLQALHKEYNKKGLEVVAFPCNQFGKQEPAGEAAINAFCKKKFGIEFDMFAKVQVKGKNQVELYRRLTGHDLAPAGKGDVRWNFEKFLVGKDGKPLARFRSNIAPDDKTLIAKLETALGIKQKKAEEEKAEEEKTKMDPKASQSQTGQETKDKKAKDSEDKNKK